VTPLVDVVGLKSIWAILVGADSTFLFELVFVERASALTLVHEQLIDFLGHLVIVSIGHLLFLLLLLLLLAEGFRQKQILHVVNIH